LSASPCLPSPRLRVSPLPSPLSVSFLSASSAVVPSRRRAVESARCVMQFTVLVGFLVVLTVLGLAAQDPAVAAKHLPPALCAGAYVAVSALLSWLGAALSLRAMKGTQEVPPAALRRQGMLSLAQQLWMAGGLGLAIWGGYGHWITQEAGLGDVPVLAPRDAIAPPGGARWTTPPPAPRRPPAPPTG